MKMSHSPYSLYLKWRILKGTCFSPQFFFFPCKKPKFRVKKNQQKYYRLSVQFMVKFIVGKLQSAHKFYSYMYSLHNYRSLLPVHLTVNFMDFFYSVLDYQRSTFDFKSIN